MNGTWRRIVKVLLLNKQHRCPVRHLRGRDTPVLAILKHVPGESLTSESNNSPKNRLRKHKNNIIVLVRLLRFRKSTNPVVFTTRRYVGFYSVILRLVKTNFVDAYTIKPTYKHCTDRVVVFTFTKFDFSSTTVVFVTRMRAIFSRDESLENFRQRDKY